MNYFIKYIILSVAVYTSAIGPEIQYMFGCFDSAPGSTIYPKEKIELGSENTLICFVNDFFPPSINVKWTKNNVELTEGSLGRYHLNKDGTFFQVSTLTFTPQDGDVYACTVEHPALESPRTRFWEVEVNESSAGPAVFCGVGLTLGLLGVAAGTFLLVKQPQSNQGA
ncbi:H-2 class II histocompatibility antigen, A-R alpha chain-like isoform X2 [Osmerus eperlanus]|uniref:H-2 class II histocompatibility antigen, A-R alpha chain-like isoform X2 n=1 Tax=Osmerus eperlanus TaxID=29151 RepID=UPI002E0FB836